MVVGSREGSSKEVGELSLLDEAEMCAPDSESCGFNSSNDDPYRFRSSDSEADSCSFSVDVEKSGRSGNGHAGVGRASSAGGCGKLTIDRSNGEQEDGVWVREGGFDERGEGTSGEYSCEGLGSLLMGLNSGSRVRRWPR
jgi:hypothetical protein